jgi:hypothetical protein
MNLKKQAMPELGLQYSIDVDCPAWVANGAEGIHCEAAVTAMDGKPGLPDNPYYGRLITSGKHLSGI